MGCHLSSFACKGRWANTLRIIVCEWLSERPSVWRALEMLYKCILFTIYQIFIYRFCTVWYLVPSLLSVCAPFCPYEPVLNYTLWINIKVMFKKGHMSWVDSNQDEEMDACLVVTVGRMERVLTCLSVTHPSGTETLGCRSLSYACSASGLMKILVSALIRGWHH